jgi:hypothetical protein
MVPFQNYGLLKFKMFKYNSLSSTPFILFCLQMYWGGIAGYQLTEHYVLPSTPTGAECHMFLINVLPELMEEVYKSHVVYAQWGSGTFPHSC